MSTNVEGINYGSGSVLNGLTTPGGISYVLAWDTTNLYLRFFDGSTVGGRRIAFYADLPASSVTSFDGRTGAVTPAAGDYAVAQITGAAPLASPALTGTPTAPTAARGTNTTQLATTAFVLGQATTNALLDTSAAPQSYVLPAATGNGGEIFVKDKTGNAAVNPITVTVTGGGTMDGQASWPITQNYQGFSFVDNGTSWSVK